MIPRVKRRIGFTTLSIFSISIFTETGIAQISPKKANTDAKTVVVKTNNNLSIQNNNKIFIITDSTFTPWIAKSMLSDKYYYNNFKSDTAGNIYCVADLREDYSKKQLIKLSTKYPYNSEIFETGIENKNYMSLQQDGQGNLYVKSDDGLYKLGNNKWEKVFSWYKGAASSIPFPKADGGLYARVTDWNSNSKNTSIVKFENGEMKQIGKNGTPLQLLNGNDWFVVGRDGSIYSYYSHLSHLEHKTKTTYMYRWNGNKWENTGTLPAKITYIDFDKNNILYAAGSNNGDDWFFKKWDGTVWSDVKLPEGLNKGIAYHPIFDEAKNVYMVGKKDVATIVYKLINDNWVEQVRNAQGLQFYFSVGEFFPANGHVYGIGTPLCSISNSAYLYRYETPRWVKTKREVAYVPVSVPTLSYSDSLHLSNYYLFESDGLKGILNSQGCVIVKPIFNEIRLVLNPGDLCTNESYTDRARIYDSNFVLRMTKGMDIIYVEFPVRQKILNRVYKTTCPTCHGSGEVGGGERTREIKGEYVEEKTTQIKKLGLNGWYWETTKTPGYYKDIKNIKEKVPVTSCSQCKGKTKISIFDENYNNKIRNKYIQIWGR